MDSPETLEGWLIHEILRRVLLRFLHQDIKKPDTAVKTALSIFDTEGPRLAASFFQPGFDDLRAEVKRSVKTAVLELFRMLQTGGFTIRSVEEPYSLKVCTIGIDIEGRPDLVLQESGAVIDFKRGGVNYRHNELASGVGLQLAVYGHLVRRKSLLHFRLWHT